MARTPPCAPTISASPPAATTSARSSSRSAVAAPSSVSTADRSNARWAAGGRARRRTLCHEAKHCRKRNCPPKRSSDRPSCRSTRSTRNPGSWASVTRGEVSVRRGTASTDFAEARATSAEDPDHHLPDTTSGLHAGARPPRSDWTGRFRPRPFDYEAGHSPAQPCEGRGARADNGPERRADMPTVYGVSASPFVRKVRVVLAEKRVTYELEPIVPVNVPSEYRQISPLGKVPAFRDGDRALADSS